MKNQTTTTKVKTNKAKASPKNRINELLGHLEKLEPGMDLNDRSGKKGYQIRKALRKLGHYVSKN